MNRYSIWSWNRRFEVSGAMYSVVPQNVYVMLFEHSINLANTKSQSLIYPSLSSKTFSSFRSLNYCFWHLEIPTGILDGNNLFSFPWNGKFSSVLWVRLRLGQIRNTGAYQVEMGEAVHEQLKPLPGSKLSGGILFSLYIIYYYPFNFFKA